MAEEVFGADLYPDDSPVEGQEEFEEERQVPEDDAGETEAPEAKAEGPGDGNDWEQFKQTVRQKHRSVDDFLESYRNQEQAITRMGQENAQLRQAFQQMQNQMQQAAYQQAMATQGQPQQQAHQQQQQQQEQQVDPEKWVERLVSEGPKAVDDIVERRLKAALETKEREFSQALGAIGQQVQGMQSRVQQEQQLEAVKQQANSCAAKYEDWEEMKPAMAGLINQTLNTNPNAILMPGFFDAVYWQVKGPQLEGQEQQQQSARKKQAARMPGSSGKTVQGRRQKTPDEVMNEVLFGKQAQPDGIFG